MKSAWTILAVVAATLSAANVASASPSYGCVTRSSGNPRENQTNLVYVQDFTASDGEVYHVFDLKVTTVDDWTNSKLRLTLTSGHFYLSDNYTAPEVTRAPGKFIQGDPACAFDTYVTTPRGFPNVAGNNVVPNLVNNADPEVYLLDARHLNISWFDTVSGTGVTNATIARIAVSGDAHGTFYGQSLDINTNVIIYPDDGVFDGFVPEPATMSLLALGGAALVRRRK